MPELQVMIEGVFEKRRLLDIIRDFIVFEDEGKGPLAKKMAGYHQFHAVKAAVGETLRAAAVRTAPPGSAPAGRHEAGTRPGGDPGDRRVRVVLHTQGSGERLTIGLYARRV